jgi:hypothetical protein
MYNFGSSATHHMTQMAGNKKSEQVLALHQVNKKAGSDEEPAFL